MRKKSQRFLSLFLSLVTVVQMVGVVPAAAADNRLSGAGTAENPYQISSEDDLALMTEQLNGTGAADFVNAYYQVTQDIELEEEVTPIATFSGVLDGDGHTISGLTVDSSTTQAALILANNGTISDLGMTHVSISGTPSSGDVKRAAFAIENHGAIENCYATGSLSGGWRVGGIATQNYGTVENCYFVGSVSGNWETGGIVAWCAETANSITNCYAKVTGSATNSSIGAITGYAYAPTILKGNVALDGALTSKGSISRICGKEKSTPITYQNNLSCEDLLINGSKITDGTADNKNGLNKTAAELTQQETYTAIGWDFENVWTMDETLGRPTLRSCPESADAVEYPMPEGSGTEESPYCIADEENLKLVIAAINSSVGGYAEAYYQLTDDITVNGAIPSVFTFSGVFDGNGHSIDGYELSTSDETDALFRKNEGTIRRLALTDVEVTGPGTPETSRRAPLCFQNYGTIEECFVTGNVSGGHRAGGIVAENYKTIQNCYFKGDVVGGCETAGITAWNQTTGIVKNCYVSGSITTLSNNSGFIGGYGYTGTLYQGNVVLSGSALTTESAKNYARICGRNNGTPTYTDNLACEDVTLNGQLVTDGAADNINGLNKTAAELTQQETYAAIGWDFDTVWTMDETLGRPALRSCREKAPEVDVEQPDKQTFTVSSPDQDLVATVYVTADNELGYSVRLNESDVLLRASLGLTVNGVDMGQDITLGNPVMTTDNETYATRGMHTTARNHYNQAAFSVTHEDGAAMTLNVRAYDDGIAFQYVMPDGSVTISGDDTRFALPTSAKAFFQYGDNADGSESYEGIRNMQGVTTASTVAGIGKGRLLCALPTFQLADKSAYVCITEANIYDWSGMGLRAEGDGVLKAEYWDANGKTFTTEEDSPWRVAIIADNLTDFVNSDMVTNVSEPEDESLFTDKSYIQPGRSVWTTQGGGASTVEGYKEYSKYASQLGIEFNLIEARTGFGDTLEQQFKAIKEIADYSAELENPVKIWIWEDAPTTRYAGGLYVEANARAFLQSCKDAGVVGVKIDHIHSEAPDKVSFYENFNKLAAEYKIMVSYHNPSKPSGLSRTYPNEMTREAIRGLQYKTDPNENAILPFTRLLAGGADYTPMNFTNGSKLGSASWVHMLANTVIMTSPYLQFSENPKNMVGQVYTDFIKAVPSVWDETTVLEQSEIGKAAAYLRRSGEDWYLAVQNSANGAQEMTFDLDFLGEGDWYADIYYDNLNVAATVKRRVEQVTKESSLTAQIRSGGGYVVRLTKTPISYEPEEGKTYEINTVEDMDLIRQHPDASFNLNADLTLSGTFRPIPVLNGTINGNGHTITGLRVSNTDASAALILQNNGIIRQMGLTDVLIDGPYTSDNSWRASLCVKNYGAIEECYALGSVSGGHRNGGLVSENYNTIKNCYFIGALESNYETGGITSWNQDGTASVVNCYAAGDYVSRHNNIGFISGYAYSGTRMTGNVALNGSLRASNNSARICGRNNGVDEATTYQNNLACSDILVNGAVITDGALNNKNGQDKTAADLKQQATYADIGWDFDKVWSMDAVLGRPVLKNVAEKSVQREITTADTIWRYLDDGADPAAGKDSRTAWTLPSFDDSSWSVGKGSFGAKKGAVSDLGGGCVPNTLLRQYKADGKTDKEAFFFRTTVTVDNPSDIEAITGSITYDDAAIVYLNGQVIAAFDADNITENLQYGGSNASDPKVGIISATGAARIASLLKAGENTVAVELHQGRAESSDIYMDMTSFVFEKVHVVEQNSISLSPGSNESQMNFSWYASTEEAGTVLVAKTSQLADGAMPADAQQVTAQSAESNKSGFYSNQCTVTGLEADTEYAYQLVNGSTVSPVYRFTTAQSGAFKFLFAGDPQLGASGDLTSDNSGWASTLAAAAQKVPDAAFLLSAGDQVNTADNEAQYSAYLEQTQLYNLPVATVVGNHDSASNAYGQHFNVANESSYGRTNAGGDYWFCYNGVLFMVLNVNNMSAAEHQAFMKNAIDKNQDASWKVVAMHHSVYSVANHATESDILQRRNELVPIFKALDVDVVLQGHDHVYVRSYMMDGLTPVADPAEYDTPEMNSVTDTDDILYITANSASGSKYYEIKNESFDYAAVKSQEHAPTYSEVSVSASQFRITTYRTNDGTVLDTFAINRSAEEPVVTGIEVTTAPSKLSYTAGENFSAAGMVVTAAYSDGTSRAVTDYTVTPDRALTADDTAVTISYQGFTARVAITVTESSGSGSGGSGSSGSSATYVITVKSAANGTISVSHKSATKNDTVAITVKPDAGYELDTLKAFDKNGDKVKVVEKNGKYTFTMPASKVTVEATFVESKTLDNPFTDVNEDAYYFDAVLWAVKNGVTSGTTATTFAPSATCTRAQAVTFLWRAMGSPEPTMTGNPFSDVAANTYYYKAVLWAVEQGITVGTTDTTFSPNAHCSRAQIVTFLWRSAESPKASAVNPFADVATDAYYADAVLWAAEEGITSGTTETTFSPNADCTRAQIVTFLWRAMAE